MATPSVEDYMKAIYRASQEAGQVSTQDIALQLAVSQPAVSKMLRRLVQMNLVEHTPYQGIELTEAGRKMAIEIVRHHRLLERYLVEALGYGWEQVHEEAERLEHHISEEFEQRIDLLMGHPQTCPHGDPIPTLEGQIAATVQTTLAQQKPGDFVIQRVSDRDAALLCYLKEQGLLPGTALKLEEREPFGGAFVVQVASKTVRIAPGAAAQIFVSETSGQ